MGIRAAPERGQGCGASPAEALQQLRLKVLWQGSRSFTPNGLPNIRSAGQCLQTLLLPSVTRGFDWAPCKPQQPSAPSCLDRVGSCCWNNARARMNDREVVSEEQQHAMSEMCC